MYKHLPSPVSFREDINGLRAWAVIAVLLFHFSLIGLPGGFAGVDIFFVISGYLMTAIIVRGYEKGNFSVRSFYMARVRRILPALMVVIAVLITLGWFWLPTIEYKELGTQSIFGLMFLNNFYFWESGGYFTTASEEKWLLHTWSLAIEAQFYLLYPIFIALVWRFWQSLRALTIAVGLVFFVSLFLNIMVVNWLPTATFYLLPTRGWELAAGALVYLVAKQYLLPKTILEKLYWLGWVMIIFSFVYINQTFSWPGYWAIFPVLGTSFIILAHKENCRLTNNQFAQWLGDRSYSLYLWHWPLVVVLVFAGLNNHWLWVIGFFALSLVLAHFSYHWIETPTRKYLGSKALIKEFRLIAFGVISIVGIAYVVVNSTVNRLPIAIEIAANEKNNRNWALYDCRYRQVSNSFGNCFYVNNKLQKDFGGEPDFILLGDSHAQMYASALAQAADQHHKTVMVLNAMGCSFQFTEDPSLASCQKANAEAKRIVDSYSAPLIIGSTAYFQDFESIQEYKTGYVNTVCDYANKRDVFLIRPLPKMAHNVPNSIVHDLIFNGYAEDVKVSKAEYMVKNKPVWEAQDLAAKQCGIKILNPLPYLCDESSCYGSRNGRPLFFDDDHLSEYGNKFFTPMFDSVLK